MNYSSNFQKPSLIYGVNLVDGPDSVKQMEMQPNTTAVFIDRSTPNVIFYLKSANEYGMTKTLMAYEAKDITDKVFNIAPTNMDSYVKKDELKNILTETLTEILGGKKDESVSQSANGSTVIKQPTSSSVQNNPASLKY